MKPKFTLPTGVDERISGWMRIRERQDVSQPRARPRPAITLSRQFGCEGFPLALRLQPLMEQATGEPWHIFDKELVEVLSKEEHIPKDLIQHLEDPARYLEAFGFHPRGAFTGDEAFARLAVALLHVAREGNAIIVGRGGAILCHSLANCFHFRLEASLDWRLASVARRLGITAREAASQEKAHSRKRDQFFQEHLAADAADRTFYDAVFNNERHGVEEIAAAILAYVRTGWKEK